MPPQYVWELWQSVKFEPVSIKRADLFEREFWLCVKRGEEEHSFDY